MATKEIELEKLAAGLGCLGKAADDEPIFILRAQDLTAPAVVRIWAAIAELHGCPKTLEAGMLADQMEVWQRTHRDRAKWPD